MNKWVSLTSLICLTGTVVSGCGLAGSSESASQAKPPAAEEKAAAPPKPIEMSVFYNSGAPEEQFNERWGNQLKKKFPHITFKYYQKKAGSALPDLITSGVTIDLYIDSIGAITTAGGLIDTSSQLDMTELVKKHSLDMNKFEPTSVEMVKQLGGLYGVPVHTTSLVLFYNKEIFNRLGVPFPKDGVTWDDIADLSRQLSRSDGGKLVTGFAVSPVHYFRMNQLSASFLEPKEVKPAINTDAWRRIMETVFIAPNRSPEACAKLEALKKVPGADQFAKTQDAAMFVYFVDFKNSEKAMESFDWDMVSVPVFKDKPGVGAQTYPTYMSVTVGSKLKDETMEVIRYVASEEFQLELSKGGIALPVLENDPIKKAFAQNNMFKDKNNQAVFRYKFAPGAVKSRYDSFVEGQLNKVTYDIAQGTMDINTALRSAEEAAAKALEAQLKK